MLILKFIAFALLILLSFFGWSMLACIAIEKCFQKFKRGALWLIASAAFLALSPFIYTLTMILFTEQSSKSSKSITYIFILYLLIAWVSVAGWPLLFALGSCLRKRFSKTAFVIRGLGGLWVLLLSFFLSVSYFMDLSRPINFNPQEYSGAVGCIELPFAPGKDVDIIFSTPTRMKRHPDGYREWNLKFVGNKLHMPAEKISNFWIDGDGWWFSYGLHKKSTSIPALPEIFKPLDDITIKPDVSISKVQEAMQVDVEYIITDPNVSFRLTEPIQLEAVNAHGDVVWSELYDPLNYSLDAQDIPEDLLKEMEAGKVIFRVVLDNPPFNIKIEDVEIDYAALPRNHYLSQKPTVWQSICNVFGNIF